MNAIGVHIVRFVCNLCSMSLSDRSLSVCVRAVCCSSERERKRWNVCIDGRECVPLSYHRENIVFAVLVGWLLSFRLTRYPIHLLHFSGLSHQFDCYNTDSTHRKTEKKAKASIIHSCSSCEYTRASNAKYSLKDEREREKKEHNTQQPQKQRLRQLKKHSRRMNTQKWIKQQQQQQQQFIVSEWRRRRRTIETKATERAKVKTIKQAETEKSDTHTHTHTLAHIHWTESEAVSPQSAIEKEKRYTRSNSKLL